VALPAEIWSQPPPLPRPEDAAVVHLVQAQVDRVRLRSFASNAPVLIERIPPPLRVVGSGTDAVVVAHPELPAHVFKVFAPESLEALDQEQLSYSLLGSSDHFATCFGRGERHLVLSYEPGLTLYQCLEQGVPVPEQVILDVQAARAYARSRGLNPKDVHLHNVLVQDGRAKILDVSKYVLPGETDRTWDHLLQGYYEFYPLIEGRRIPAFVLDLAKRMYKAQAPERFSLPRYGQRMAGLLRRLGIISGSVRLSDVTQAS